MCERAERYSDPPCFTGCLEQCQAFLQQLICLQRIAHVVDGHAEGAKGKPYAPEMIDFPARSETLPGQVLRFALVPLGTSNPAEKPTTNFSQALVTHRFEQLQGLAYQAICLLVLSERVGNDTQIAKSPPLAPSIAAGLLNRQAFCQILRRLRHTPH